jgi:hypothetical protein
MCRSQDSWVFVSPVPDSILKKTDYFYGWLGSDNRICYEFQQAKYKVINPCFTITTRHLHITEKRNYTKANTVKGDYATVAPGEL